MNGKMDCCGLTDIGRKRRANEDQFLIADLSKSMRVHQTSLGLDHQTRLFGNSQGKLLAVADGMGGHEAGERASQLVVDSVVTYVLNTLQWYFRLNLEQDHDFQDDLKAALEHCQEMLRSDAETVPQRQGMGTTLTLAYIIWPRMYVVHVGDSRCYLLRNSRLKQVTRDHTMAQLYKESTEGGKQEDGGEDDETSNWSNVLWNVIGSTEHAAQPEVYQVNLELEDTVLLCTDGLTKHVGRSRLVELLDQDVPTENVCQQLVDEANERGGSDNITVVVSRFREVDSDLETQAEHTEIPFDVPPTDPLADTAPLPTAGRTK